MNRRFRKIIAALLSLLLITQLLPLNVWAEKLEESSQLIETADAVVTDDATVNSADVPDGEQNQTIVGEVEEYRDEREKHFRLADGSFLAVNYGMPVHYSVDEDTWEDIDNTLVLYAAGNASGIASTGQAGGDAAQQYAAVNGDNAKIFASTLNDGFLFAAQRGSAGVQMRLLDGLTADADASDETVREEPDSFLVEPEAATTPDDAPESENTTETVDDPEPEMTTSSEETIPTEALPEETTDTVLTDETVSPDTSDPADTDSEDAEQSPSPETETGADVIQDTESPVPEETSPESETASPTTPETAHETESGDIPETTADVLTEIPIEDETVCTEDSELYNRSCTAQISYPDQPTASVDDSDSTNALPENPTETDDQTPTLYEQIIPKRLRAQVLYEDVFAGVDILYEIQSYDIKESILIKKPLSGYTFQFELNLVGLTPVLQADGSVILMDADQEVIYLIPAPYMVDASGAYSEDAFYTLSQDNLGNWVLSVTASRDWIESEDRTFPVSIDPTLIDYSTANDFVGTVCNEQNTVVSTNQNLVCGYHPEYGKCNIYYKLDSDNLPAIPAGHTLVRAQAGFNFIDFRSGSNSSTDGKLVLCMSQITENVTLDGNLTWDNRPDIGPTLDYIDSSWSNVGQMAYWDVTAAAKSWYAGGDNFGLAMTSNATSTTMVRAWFSYSDQVAFIVSYRSTNGIEDYYTYQTAGVGNAGTAYISDYTGQLTVCKNLVSYASTVNPFSLDLVYNSSYALYYDTNYDTGGQLGMNMHVGAGCTLSVMQQVKGVTLQNDSSSSTISYLKYTDGDGTIHYFCKDSSQDSTYYYDEDGMGLKIKENSGTYIMSDDHGNSKTFTNGLLNKIEDANGNQIEIIYTRSDGTTGLPTVSGSRISEIRQINDGCSAITVATFTYNTTAWLQTITDAAGNVYTFSYSSGKLSQITRGSTTIARFDATSTRMGYVYDAEAQYGIGFTYTAGQISRYYEITSAGTLTGNFPGIVVGVSHGQNGQAIYRDYGNDRTESTDDDILTCYTFDYAGRTVNAYTTDPQDNIWGASNAVYSGVGTTDKTNNRTMRTSSIGVSAMNLLHDHGFESGSEWTFTLAGSNTNILAKAESPRTGLNSCKGWIKVGQDVTISATRSTRRLIAGQTYTLSAYVNTSQCTSFSGDGVYLKVSGNGISAQSDFLNYKTSSAVDDGWARLSVTFTATSTANYTVGIYNNGAGPYFFADDFQLENSAAPSNLNLLENGDLQYWNYGWTMGSLAAFKTGVGLFSTDSTAYSIRLGGDAYTASSAYQDIPINEAGGTYVLSGWAKANAVPDNEQTATGTDAAARDTVKQFGLRAMITYSDGATEYHYVPFNPDVTEWQFVSTAIVPKQSAKTVSTIRVILAYERNANEAFFDNLSLTKEAAQTMKYDSDGNLVSVKSTGSSEETATYSSGNLTKLCTGGSGTFTYTYDSSHNLKTATNGLVTQTLTYDAMGNALTAKITPSGSSSGILTTNTYTNSGNLLASVTQRGAYTTTYAYAEALNRMYGLASSVTDPRGLKVSSTYDTAGRVTGSTVSDTSSDALGSVAYTYSKGMLANLSRTVDSTTQKYSFTYDSFGNLTKLQVGSKTLGQYEYNSKNGLLKKQTYGNGKYTSFEYDNLGRNVKTTTSDGDVYTYTYTGDGQLYSVTDTNGGTPLLYRYTHDTLGRIVNSSQTGGSAEVRASYTYDSESRLNSVNYSIPGVVDSAAETFYYSDSNSGNTAAGALTKMAMFSNSWIYYRYDSYCRLSERDVGNILTEKTTYLAGSGSCATTPLPQTFQATAKDSSTVYAGFQYTYDSVGNITRETNTVDGSYTAYSYDTLGQLRYATDYNSSGTALLRYFYTYDSAGNITSVTQKNGAGTTTLSSVSYGYTDSNWKDLLTSYDGHTITYDGAGNPLSYYNGQSYTMTWRNGRELNTVTTGGKTYSYEYDANGLRTRKTNSDGGYTEYYYVDGLAVAEQRYLSSGSLSYTIRYYYDESNIPVGFGTQYSGTTYWTSYYFAKNLQGDVVALYRSDYNSSTASSYGTLIATYEYDPYGRPLGIYNTSGTEISQTASHIAAFNPFRYRGYRYDGDTGLYYLESRYYDPVVGRFINADSYASTGQGLLGHNMFAYCNNNPVNSIDSLGLWTISISGTFSCVFGLGISLSFGFAFDDQWHFDWQYSYAIPGIDGTGTVGIAGIGIGAAVQYTKADTVFDLYGPATYTGASVGPSWYVGGDIVSFSDASDTEMTADGFQFVAGVGVGLDVHVTESYTRTINQANRSAQSGLSGVVQSYAAYTTMLY